MGHVLTAAMVSAHAEPLNGSASALALAKRAVGVDRLCSALWTFVTTVDRVVENELANAPQRTPPHTSASVSATTTATGDDVLPRRSILHYSPQTDMGTVWSSVASVPVFLCLLCPLSVFSLNISQRTSLTRTLRRCQPCSSPLLICECCKRKHYLSFVLQP